MAACVYVLRDSAHRMTYVGSTVNPARRLRQHNGEIAGGAKSTTRRIRPDSDAAEHSKWEYAAIIRSPSFVDRRIALSFEWHLRRELRPYRGKRRLDEVPYAVARMQARFPGAALCCASASADAAAPAPAAENQERGGAGDEETTGGARRA